MIQTVETVPIEESRAPSAAPSTEPSETRVVSIEWAHRDIYERPPGDEKSWTGAINKMVDVKEKEEQASEQGVNLGLKEHPFNMAAAIAFKNQNPHHSTCIEAKTRALVGLGFVDEEKVPDELDPLCDSTFHEVIQAIGEDYWQVGNGYMEVVRDEEGDTITGLHHVPAATVQVCIEDVSYRKHYIVGGTGEGVTPRIMAPYGELDDFLSRAGLKEGGEPESLDDGGDANEIAETTGAIGGYASVFQGYGTPSKRSEIIHFQRRTSMSRWYGFPDWLSAVASIELVQCMTQERYDFFLNRGVPEFMVFVTGAKIAEKEWTKLENAMKATLGPGNQHKSVALNIAEDGVEIKIEKLAMDGAGSDAAFTEMSETLALDIVTAHRTPPLLAGIQIPGKLGAVNELPNALLAFQVLVIGPEQVTFEAVLASTLGNRKLNGGLPLRRKDFKFKKITEEIPLGMVGQTGGQGAGTEGAAGIGKPKAGASGTGKPGLKEMDTMSRMRTPAAAGGRNLSAGVKK